MYWSGEDELQRIFPEGMGRPYHESGAPFVEKMNLMYIGNNNKTDDNSPSKSKREQPHTSQWRIIHETKFRPKTLQQQSNKHWRTSCSY
jgi:hypothetical protein